MCGGGGVAVVQWGIVEREREREREREMGMRTCFDLP